MIVDSGNCEGLADLIEPQGTNGKITAADALDSYLVPKEIVIEFVGFAMWFLKRHAFKASPLRCDCIECEELRKTVRNADSHLKL